MELTVTCVPISEIPSRSKLPPPCPIVRELERLRELAGLPRDLVLYLARHPLRPESISPAPLTTDHCQLSIAKLCREKGIEFARRLLGHANISTTQRYMHLDDRELADAQDLVE